jgi:hypothetical protein
MVAIFLLGGVLLIMSSCGGGSSSNLAPSGSTPSSSTQSSQPSNTQVLVGMGDSPSDWIMAFSMIVGSMTLTGTNASTVNIVSTATPLEMMRLMGTVQPLVVASIPQGTYTKATITMNSAVITYMDPGRKTVLTKTVTGPVTGTVDLSPGFTVGSTPMVLNFDMDMASSVSIDSVGTASVTPTFRSSMEAVTSGNQEDVNHGAMEQMMGSVTSTSGNTFALSMMQGAQPITFQTVSGTQFMNMAGMGMMSDGMLLSVDAVMQPDGTAVAHRVDFMMGSGGMMADGTVIKVSGSPATTLTLIMQNGAGSGVGPSDFGPALTVNIGSGSTYQLDSDAVDMNGLPFTPVFDGSYIFAGQRVEAVSGSAMMPGTDMGGGMMGGGTSNGTVGASEIHLEQQGFSGTVSAYSPRAGAATFTLGLASDSAFASLTGSTSLTVFQQPETQLLGLSSVDNGNTIHVRGLLFLDSGAWKLVAARIMAP